ncbi:FG-GAP-like repeat-containing protein [Paucibacter sp. XJ19-41]|uniref:FG-GAP-like repeat-containing protein n=1 Tax=Paucibacter sp. XJ19-41 TaxID=2927824 RepID=UPI00234AFDE0|nr:FG-GAP-like repeat-containing protein [Paucibacter sp. XJ19-41]MDC6168612.1 FG-GAP-like repeat-containing protein [Paucibacter sp. XJ19-41]
MEYLKQVTELARLNDQLAYQVRDSRSEEPEYVAINAQSASQVPGHFADALERTFGPVEIMRFGLALGETVSLADRRVSVDVTGDGREDVVELRVESAYVGNGAVTVPAGNFPQAAQLRSTARLRVTPAGQSQPLDTTVIIDEWLVPQIGPVKTQTVTQEQGRSSSELDELLAYRVGTQRTDSEAPHLLASTPAAGTVRSTLDAIVLRFSEPLDEASLRKTGAVQLTSAEGIEPLPAIRYVATENSVYIRPTRGFFGGLHTLVLGTEITDRLGNALSAQQLQFTLDPSGPRLLSSVPAHGEGDAPVTGELVLNLDRSVEPVGNAPLVLILTADDRSELEVPARQDGLRLFGTLPQALTYGQRYSVRLKHPLVDESGKALPALGLSFQATQGPLARPQARSNEGFFVTAAVLADVTGDGVADLVENGYELASSKAGIVIRAGLVSGGFGVRRQQLAADYLGLPQKGNLPVVGDFNGDGRADIAFSASGSWGGMSALLLQQADGSFQSVQGMDSQQSALASMILDGEPGPALIHTDNSSFRASRRGANGIWKSQHLLLTGGNGAAAWRVADLNGDGRQDLVWLRYQAGNQWELAWAHQTAGGAFSAAHSRNLPAGGLLSYALELADLNGDGRPDAVLTTPAKRLNSSLLVILNDGRGQLDAAPQASPVFEEGWGEVLMTGDLNGDGRRDVFALGGSSAHVYVYLQGEDGRMQTVRRFEHFGPPGSGAFVQLDLNGDGLMDLLTGQQVIYGRNWSGPWPQQSIPAALPDLQTTTQSLRNGPARLLGK